MAISVLPPTAFKADERSDIQALSTLIVTLTNVLNADAVIASADRTITAGSLTSLNKTLTDASDRIDAIVNPAAPLH